MAFPLCDLQWDYIFVKQHISCAKAKMWMSWSVELIGEGDLAKKKKKKNPHDPFNRNHDLWSKLKSLFSVWKRLVDNSLISNSLGISLFASIHHWILNQRNIFLCFKLFVHHTTGYNAYIIYNMLTMEKPGEVICHSQRSHLVGGTALLVCSHSMNLTVWRH